MDMYYESMAAILEEDISQELKNTIHYHNITHDDMLNGDGLRVVLWVAGCEHKCKECQNPITWDCDGGIPLTQWEEAEFWEWLSKPWTQGATFSGGDPLHPKNRNKIADMCREIKEKYPSKDIWIYTGYTLKEENGEFVFDINGNTFAFEALQYVDVIVDGRFECETRKKDIAENKKVYWRGSSNQRIIDIHQSMKEKKIIVREV